LNMEFNPTIPIYLQIIDEIKRQIASGERNPGSKVESVRELAQTMGVNPNTGQRAFAELEREGLMYTERTAGRYITTDISRIATLKEESAKSMIGEFVRVMLQSGFSKQDILRLVKAFMEETENG
jgi:GntR family transcriptional regulator